MRKNYLTLLLVTLIISVSCEDEGSVPNISSKDVTNITENSALSGGTLLNDGGSSIKEIGVCWNTFPNPTISDNIATVNTEENDFSCELTNLSSNTSYYVRAYATNNTGTDYGEQILFHTNFSENEKVFDIDGNAYNIVHIGEQTWMVENLKTTHYTDGKPIEEIYWYNNDESVYKEKFGALYTGQAQGSSKLAPTGWKVPSASDWKTLIEFLGRSEVAGGRLKSTDSEWLYPNTDANNSSGFSALPGGYITYDSGVNSYYFGEKGYWSSTSYSYYGSTFLCLSNETGKAMLLEEHFGPSAFSVRCLKVTDYSLPDISIYEIKDITQSEAKATVVINSDGGSAVTESGVCWSPDNVPSIADNKTTDNVANGVFKSSLSNLDESKVYYVRAYAKNSAGICYSDPKLMKTLEGNNTIITDEDGNEYHTLCIGGKIWMIENLKTTKYNDGTEIQLVTDKSEWTSLNSTAYCWYNNDDGYKEEYGALYNWYTINTEKLCPTGWHVINETDWTDMEEFLSDDSRWDIDIFPYVKGGYRDYYGGSFYEMEEIGKWWTSDSGDNEMVKYIQTDGYGFELDETVETNGFSVRCVKN